MHLSRSSSRRSLGCRWRRRRSCPPKNEGACRLVYWLMNLHTSFVRFLVSVVIILLVTNVAMSVGYFASAIAEQPETAAIVCNMVNLPLTIFGGLMVKLDETPVWLSWIQYLSFIRYGFNAATITLFRKCRKSRSPTLTRFLCASIRRNVRGAGRWTTNRWARGWCRLL